MHCMNIQNSLKVFSILLSVSLLVMELVDLAAAEHWATLFIDIYIALQTNSQTEKVNWDCTIMYVKSDIFKI